MSRIDTNKGLIAWFARNSVAANLLMWLLVVGGLFGAFSIQKQVFPNFEIDVINVRVPYLGAAPQEVEEGVLLKIEESIKDLEGIKQLNSTAVEGMGTVSIQVEEDYDVQSLLDEVNLTFCYYVWVAGTTPENEVAISYLIGFFFSVYFHVPPYDSVYGLLFVFCWVISDDYDDVCRVASASYVDYFSANSFFTDAEG